MAGFDDTQTVSLLEYFCMAENTNPEDSQEERAITVIYVTFPFISMKELPCSINTVNIRGTLNFSMVCVDFCGSAKAEEMGNSALIFCFPRSKVE